jgi:hypothetical protein
MKINTMKNSIRKIKKENPNFIINDGVFFTPRAGFEINNNCPPEYRELLVKAFVSNWVEPVAYLHEKELIMVGLSK